MFLWSVIDHFPGRRLQVFEIDQQTDVVKQPAHVDLDSVIMAVRVFALALVSAQLWAEKTHLDHHFGIMGIENLPSSIR